MLLCWNLKVKALLHFFSAFLPFLRCLSAIKHFVLSSQLLLFLIRQTIEKKKKRERESFSLSLFSVLSYFIRTMAWGWATERVREKNSNWRRENAKRTIFGKWDFLPLSFLSLLFLHLLLSFDITLSLSPLFLGGVLQTSCHPVSLFFHCGSVPLGTNASMLLRERRGFRSLFLSQDNNALEINGFDGHDANSWLQGLYRIIIAFTRHSGLLVLCM